MGPTWALHVRLSHLAPPLLFLGSSSVHASSVMLASNTLIIYSSCTTVHTHYGISTSLILGTTFVGGFPVRIYDEPAPAPSS